MKVIPRMSRKCPDRRVTKLNTLHCLLRLVLRFRILFVRLSAHYAIYFYKLFHFIFCSATVCLNSIQKLFKHFVSSIFLFIIPTDCLCWKSILFYLPLCTESICQKRSHHSIYRLWRSARRT